MIAMVKRNAHKGIPVLFVAFLLGAFVVLALGRFRLEWALTALGLGGGAALLVTDEFLSKGLSSYYFKKAEREQLQSAAAFLLLEGLLAVFIPFTGVVLDDVWAILLQIFYGGAVIIQFMYVVFRLAENVPVEKSRHGLTFGLGFLISTALIAVIAISDIVIFVVRLFT